MVPFFFAAARALPVTVYRYLYHNIYNRKLIGVKNKRDSEFLHCCSSSPCRARYILHNIIEYNVRVLHVYNKRSMYIHGHSIRIHTRYTSVNHRVPIYRPTKGFAIITCHRCLLLLETLGPLSGGPGRSVCVSRIITSRIQAYIWVYSGVAARN